jgi:IS605 OrfB family transposase
MINNKKLLIRSSKTTLSFSNPGKLSQLHDYINEYKRVVQLFVDILWDQPKVSKLINKDITSKISSWLSQRSIQCAAKQASSIVRGTKTKHNRRMYTLTKLMREGKNAKHLQRKISKTKLTKPNLDNLCPELDDRFITILNLDNSFDLWIKLSSLGNNIILSIPLRKTKHFNSLIDQGYELKKGVRLSYNDIMFNFSKSQPSIKSTGSTLGIDIGIKNTWFSSNGLSSQPDNHGHTLDSIQKILSKRRKGSNGFERTSQQRSNYINWSIKQLNLSGVRQINIENIKDLRRHKRSSRYLSHWTYTEIKDKLERLCKEQGVLVNKVDPVYSSQRCSSCGWTRKANRKGKLFRCDRCDYATDADLNGSRNISLPLADLGERRLSEANRTGFYWHEVVQEPIVPEVQKSKFL